MAAVKKKVVKKSPAKKKAPVKRAAKIEKEPVLAMFRLTTGEELIAHIDDEISPEGIIAYNPMQVSIYSGQLFLVPYALSAKQRVFYFSTDHIPSIYEVDDQFTLLYFASLRNYEDDKQLYDQVVFSSMQYAIRKRASRDTIPEPTEEDLKKIDNPAGQIKVSVNGEESKEGVRTKSKLIDDLVKLANDKGLGIDKDTKKEE